MTDPLAPPLPIADVFADMATLPAPAFEVLAKEVSEADAFDASAERVRYLSTLTGVEPEGLRLKLEALGYLYSQIHRTELGSVTLEEVLRSYLEAVGFDDCEEGRPGEAPMPDDRMDVTVQRLVRLLGKSGNADRHDLYHRLIDGPLPLATSFMPILDLRPMMADNGTQLEELIPLIQLRVRTNRNDAGRDQAFQMDRRSLRRLRDAVDLADAMLKAADAREGIGKLMTRIGTS